MKLHTLAHMYLLVGERHYKTNDDHSVRCALGPSAVATEARGNEQ